MPHSSVCPCSCRTYDHRISFFIQTPCRFCYSLCTQNSGSSPASGPLVPDTLVYDLWSLCCRHSRGRTGGRLCCAISPPRAFSQSSMLWSRSVSRSVTAVPQTPFHYKTRLAPFPCRVPCLSTLCRRPVIPTKWKEGRAVLQRHTVQMIS